MDVRASLLIGKDFFSSSSLTTCCPPARIRVLRVDISDVLKLWTSICRFRSSLLIVSPASSDAKLVQTFTFVLKSDNTLATLPAPPSLFSWERMLTIGTGASGETLSTPPFM